MCVCLLCVQALCTHRHADHSAGNAELASLAKVEVVSSAYEDVPGMTKAVKEGDTLTLGSLTITAIHSECHTR